MTYYEILEVREDASQDVINMAYKALCRKYHPDVYKGFDSEFAADIMTKINEAYEVLSNPESRAAYDKWIKMYSSGEKEFSTEGNVCEDEKQNSNNEQFREFKRKFILLTMLIIILLLFAVIGTLKYTSLNSEYKNLISERDEYKKLAAKYYAYFDTCVISLNNYYEDFAYITQDGEHYHKYGCPYIEDSDLYVNYINSLKRDGYTECSYCYGDDFKIWIKENSGFSK